MRTAAAVTFAMATVGGAAAAGPDGMDGLWVGEMRQIEATEDVRYPMTLTIVGKSATADYPKLNCFGTWTRVAAKNGYTIYAETATNKKGANCIDGIVTVTVDEGRVVLGWFASDNGVPMVATAVLSKAAK